MSETPMTDAEAQFFHGGDRLDWVKGDFARKLEKKLAEANAKVRELEQANEAVFASKLAIYEETSKLQAKVKELESLVTAGMDLETKLHNSEQAHENTRMICKRRVEELEAQVKGMRNVDKQKVMNDITEYCILAMYSVRAGMPKCETALDIEALKQKARNEYLGISDNPLNVMSCLFNCQVKRLVYSIYQAVFGQPKKEDGE